MFNTNTIIIGTRWVSRATGFPAIVTRIRPNGTVTYAWIEASGDAAMILGQMSRGEFLATFEVAR